MSKYYYEIQDCINYEKDQCKNKKHFPLYYYVLLNNNTETIMKNIDNMINYLLENYTNIKMVNGIIDEDCNGYNVFINNIE